MDAWVSDRRRWQQVCVSCGECVAEAMVRVMLTFENYGDEHNEWFDKDGPDLAPLNSKCGAGWDEQEEWRETIQVSSSRC